MPTDAKVHYAWEPIRDFEIPPEKLAVPELRSLARVWSEQRQRLEAEGRLERFTEELCREFAIETGILERLYTLDRGVTRVLIERGIDASRIPHDATDRDPAQVAAMIRDQHEAARSLFDFVAQRRTFSTSFVKELHALLTRNQESTTAQDTQGRLQTVPLRRGQWKLRPNNPQRKDGSMHEYTPPEHVASEMDRLVELQLQHEEQDLAPEVEAAWLHHRFTQIHPFQDGNGRVARCLASLVLIRAGWFPMVVDRNLREQYIETLETADVGDLRPLTSLIGRLQKDAFLRALSTAREVVHTKDVTQVIEATKRELAERERLREEAEAMTYKLQELGKQVHQVAVHRLREVRQELEDQLGSGSQGQFSFRVEDSLGDPEAGEKYWNYLTRDDRLALYSASTEPYLGWVCLRMSSNGIGTNFYAYLHGVGREPSGVLGCTAIIEHRRSHAHGYQFGDEVFQLNYLDRPEEVLERFRPWLEDHLAEALEQWRKRL